jgi:hypothetical protein
MADFPAGTAKIMRYCYRLNLLIETPAGFSYTGADCQGWMNEGCFRQMRFEHLVGMDLMVIGIR